MIICSHLALQCTWHCQRTSMHYIAKLWTLLNNHFALCHCHSCYHPLPLTCCCHLCLSTPPPQDLLGFKANDLYLELALCLSSSAVPAWLRGAQAWINYRPGPEPPRAPNKGLAQPGSHGLLNLTCCITPGHHTITTTELPQGSPNSPNPHHLCLHQLCLIWPPLE